MKKLGVVMAVMLALAGTRMECSAQDAAPPPGSQVPLRSSAELDQLLGPIALYPDPLLAVLLPASTFPTEIVMADRYMSQGGDPNQIEQQSWDPSVQSLAHYPNVLKWMDDNLTWTTEVGQAFASQQSDVMDSIQRLRSQAQALGNLPSSPQENVEDDDGSIDIEPTSPDELYVPDYQPDLIYDQPGVFCTFAVGLPIGAWLGFDWDWHDHHLVSWGGGNSHPRGWWQLPPSARHGGNDWHGAGLWRPHNPVGSVIVAGGDRGYGNRAVFRPTPAPRVAMPRQAAHSEGRSFETPRAPEVSRAPEIQRAPEVSRSFQRSQPSESVFGGSQSSREVRESSSRGQESRGGGGFSFGGGGGGRSGASPGRR